MTDQLASTVVTGANGMQFNVPTPANTVSVPAPWADLMNPTVAQNFAVNVAGMTEAITQPFYSYQNYPSAGTAGSLQFFINVPGNPSTVTDEDTNMQQANTFPAPTSFLLQGIGVDYLPGIAAARFGAESANGQLNDFYAIMRRGVLKMVIGNKPYLQMSPMMSLPVRSHINGMAALSDQTTPAAALQTQISVGFADGSVFSPRPLLIPSMQTFQISISFPLGAVPPPSADTGARIGVVIYGTQYRAVQ